MIADSEPTQRNEQYEIGGAVMQAIGSTGTTSISPQARELIRTILDAATALKRLLPDEELEHGFEFHWGHSNFHTLTGNPQGYRSTCIQL